jgi:tryptophanyl-tRNA synthetase
MKKIIDPYGSELVEDYAKAIKNFGLEEFKLELFPQPNRLMRRGVIFGGRDLDIISKCIKQKKKFYALSGIMPTNKQIHFGNKSVVENLAYFQKHGAKTFILVADLESAAARGVPLEEARKRALNFHIPAYLALGLDPKKTIFYFQSENTSVTRLGFEFAKKITLNEFRAIYGSADPGRIMSAVIQAGDILYPQLEELKPGIIPVGLDQDPHIRLTRDLVKRYKSRKKFFPPSSIYHKYMPSLDGNIKMSKSEPLSCISLPEEPNDFIPKLKRALTGGRDTLEEQKRIGGIPEKCMIFELYKQHLIEDDKELQKVYDDCKAGKLLCGEDKANACKKMTAFMEQFNKRLRQAKRQVKHLNFARF